MKNYKNYKLVLKENLEDIKSEGYFFEHKSGSKVICIDNDDENRVFSVCFKTLPQDNTGLAHIMEHCVLCGSEKFRIKDPFNELDKGSLNTYLNALTFSDKTLFPIASTNEREFYNLMEVYLDAVFFPLIYERKGIFLQEGWHKTKTGINGVVYNEMLGAFSEPEQIMDFEITRELFKDNYYKYYSAGLPESIPELSYENFLDFHRKYYHPANSVIYVYGKNDIIKCLDFIDNFLSRFDYKQIKTEYKVQPPFYEPKDAEFYYDGEESLIGAGFASFFSCDFVKAEAMNILCSALFNSEASPVKHSLIKSGICEDAEAYIDDDMYQGVLFIKLHGSKEKNSKKFKKVLMNALNEVYSKGLDDRLLKGCILNEKFYLSEGDFGYKPKGLFYNLRLLQGFVYGKENFDGLKFGDVFEELEKMDYMKLLKEAVIDNKHCVYGILKKGDTSEKSKNFDFIKCNEDKFLEYQNIEDKKEDKEKIPGVMLSEISQEPLRIESLISDNGRIIFNPKKNDEIVYINLVLDTSSVPFELKQYMGLYIYLLGKMNTLNYGFEELNNDINYYFGGFDIYFSSYYLKEDRDFLTGISINVKAFRQNSDKIFEIIKEVIFNTDFSDLKRIEILLKELKNKTEESFYTDGNAVAALRCLSYFNALNNYEENIRGIKFYNFFCKILEEKSFEEVAFKLLKLKDYLLRKNNAFLSFSSSVKDRSDILNHYKKLYDCLSEEKNKNKYLCIDENKYLNEGFVLKSGVNYNIMAADYFKTGFRFSGKLQVINKIIASDYLWNKVRAENGAYGADLSIKRNGIMFFSSYRDPKVENTFLIYEKTFDYLSGLSLEKNDLKKYIIGTINILDRPIKDNMLNEIALFRHFLGLDHEKLKMEREEILCFENKDINAICVMFSEALKESFFCSVGNESDIKAAVSRFNAVKKLRHKF